MGEEWDTQGLEEEGPWYPAATEFYSQSEGLMSIRGSLAWQLISWELAALNSLELFPLSMCELLKGRDYDFQFFILGSQHDKYLVSCDIGTE